MRLSSVNHVSLFSTKSCITLEQDRWLGSWWEIYNIRSLQTVRSVGSHAWSCQQIVLISTISRRCGRGLAATAYAYYNSEAELITCNDSERNWLVMEVSWTGYVELWGMKELLPPVVLRRHRALTIDAKSAKTTIPSRNLTRRSYRLNTLWRVSSKSQIGPRIT
jgi:hypothetical protein